MNKCLVVTPKITTNYQFYNQKFDIIYPLASSTSLVMEFQWLAEHAQAGAKGQTLRDLQRNNVKCNYSRRNPGA